MFADGIFARGYFQEGYLFQSSVIWGVVGISPVEAYERVGKSVISVCKKAHVGWQIHFMALKNSGLVIYWYFKDSPLTAAKKNAKF